MENEDIIDVNGEELASIGEPTNYIQRRDEIIKKYRAKKNNLLDQIATDPNSSSVEVVISAVIEELFHELDNIYANQIILTERGDLEKASALSVKRSDMLDTLSKIAVRKKDVVSDNNEVDLNGPVFQIFQQICFERLADSLDQLEYQDDEKKIIIQKWIDVMEGWDKELKNRKADLDNG